MLYGPNVPLDGGAPNTTPGAGKVAGTEYLAYSVDANGQAAATLMVQIPSTFSQSSLHSDRDLVRIARRLWCRLGGWRMGLEARLRSRLHRQRHRQWRARTRHQHDYVDQRAHRQRDNRRKYEPLHGDDERFSAHGISATNPFRYAFKHAHSQANPEKDWGLFTRQAIEFALWAVNEQFAPTVPGTISKRVIRGIQHFGDRRVGFQRRRSFSSRGRRRYNRIDRRRGRWRAANLSDVAGRVDRCAWRH